MSGAGTPMGLLLQRASDAAPPQPPPPTRAVLSRCTQFAVFVNLISSLATLLFIVHTVARTRL